MPKHALPGAGANQQTCYPFSERSSAPALPPSRRGFYLCHHSMKSTGRGWKAASRRCTRPLLAHPRKARLAAPRTKLDLATKMMNWPSLFEGEPELHRCATRAGAQVLASVTYDEAEHNQHPSVGAAPTPPPPEGAFEVRAQRTCGAKPEKNSEEATRSRQRRHGIIGGLLITRNDDALFRGGGGGGVPGQPCGRCELPQNPVLLVLALLCCCNDTARPSSRDSTARAGQDEDPRNCHRVMDDKGLTCT
eukprot:COSAG04_NODE_9683_length_841_cov_0.830189_1_plen_248_part_10